MSTTFGVKVPSQGDPIVIAYRSGGIRFTNPLAELLQESTPVIPLDNTAQGIETIGDIIKEIKEQNDKGHS